MKESYLERAYELRRTWAKGDGKRDEGLAEPENIMQVKNLSYAGRYGNANEDTAGDYLYRRNSDLVACNSTMDRLADLYYPQEKGGKFPVIVSIHGGGWFYGNKELYRFYCMHLATYGFLVVNFNYRLSPEFQYPAGFHDVCRLFAKLKEWAKEYPMDLSRLYVVGDSAGAQLTSQYSVYATNKAYRDFFDFTDIKEAPVPNKVALNCGVYDMKNLEHREDDLNAWYMSEHPSKEEEESFLNVLDYMTKDFPPTFLMCSVNDALGPNTEPMKKRLEELEIPCIYKEYGQDNKDDGHVFHINLRSKNGLQCNQDEINFFETF